MEALSFDLSSYFEQIALARHKFRNADLETMLGEVWQQIHRIPPDTPGYPRIPQKKSTGYPRIPQVCRINSSSLSVCVSHVEVCLSGISALLREGGHVSIPCGLCAPSIDGHVVFPNG